MFDPTTITAITEDHAVLRWMIARMGAARPDAVRTYLFDDLATALREHLSVIDHAVADVPGSALPREFVDAHWYLKRCLSQLQDMNRETELFLEAIMREDRSILEIIDADFTFVDQRLAEHYDLPERGKLFEVRRSRFGRPIRSSEFKRVQLTDGLRGGILTQASVLTITSNPTRTSPVKRTARRKSRKGSWKRRRLRR